MAPLLSANVSAGLRTGLCRALHPFGRPARISLLAVWGLAACNRAAVCPTNQAASTPEGAKAPVKSAGTYDKNGRFKKKNAYHPSARHAGN